jgi:hypothetical protein
MKTTTLPQYAKTHLPVPQQGNGFFNGTDLPNLLEYLDNSVNPESLRCLGGDVFGEMHPESWLVKIPASGRCLAEIQFSGSRLYLRKDGTFSWSDTTGG